MNNLISKYTRNKVYLQENLKRQNTVYLFLKEMETLDATF